MQDKMFKRKDLDEQQQSGQFYEKKEHEIKNYIRQLMRSSSKLQESEEVKLPQLNQKLKRQSVDNPLGKMQQSLLTDFKPQIREKIRPTNPQNSRDQKQTSVNSTFENVMNPQQQRGGTQISPDTIGNERQGRSRDRNPRSQQHRKLSPDDRLDYQLSLRSTGSEYQKKNGRIQQGFDDYVPDSPPRQNQINSESRDRQPKYASRWDSPAPKKTSSPLRKANPRYDERNRDKDAGQMNDYSRGHVIDIQNLSERIEQDIDRKKKGNQLDMRKITKSDNMRLQRPSPARQERDSELSYLNAEPTDSYLKPTREELEFQREVRNRILDNIDLLKNGSYSAGSETLDKILLDFYKGLYDDRPPVQQEKYETTAFLVDFFQQYIKKQMKDLDNFDKRFKSLEEELDKQQSDNLNLKQEISNLKTRLENSNRMIEHEQKLNQQAQQHVDMVNQKSKDLEKTFQKNVAQYKDLIAEANKQMDLKNLESVELNNRIISLENQVKIEKEVNENARQDISRLRDITENAQNQIKDLNEEIYDLLKQIDILNHERDALAKKVIEWELNDRNIAVLNADLDASKQINRIQSKDMLDLKRKLNESKLEQDAIKYDKHELEQYLRNIKNHNHSNSAEPTRDLSEKKIGYLHDLMPSTSAKKRQNKSPQPQIYSSILQNYEDDIQNHRTNRDPRRHKIPLSFEQAKPANAPNYSASPSIKKYQNASEVSYNMLDNQNTHKYLGKYKFSDPNFERNPAGKPSKPTHIPRPKSSEYGGIFNSDIDQWEHDQTNVKELDRELTKFQRTKVFIENDLLRIKSAPNSMGEREKRDLLEKQLRFVNDTVADLKRRLRRVNALQTNPALSNLKERNSTGNFVLPYTQLALNLL